ncbi:MAG: ABC transporter ATP-binding protein, partial [Christensenellales bacterium]
MPDKQKKRKFQKGTLQKVLACVGRHRLLIAVSILFAVVTVLLTLYVPILIGQAIDLIVGKGNVDFAGVLSILVRIAVVVLINAALQWLMGIINNKITYRVIRDVRNRAFEKLEILPLKYIDAHAHGEIVSRLISDVDQFAEGLLLGFTNLFTGVVTILGTLVFMLTIHWQISLVVVVLTPLSLFVARFISRKTYSMFRLQSETRGEQTAFINEMIGNQKVVRAFSHEKEALRQFDEINDRMET